MDVQIAALCDSAVDYSGKLCLLGAFDSIYVQRFPAVHPHCSIALRLVFNQAEEGRHQLRLTLIDADGRSLLPKIEPVVEVRMGKENYFATSNLVFNLQGMKFDKPGQYSIDITLDENMIARIPLQVILMKPTPPVPPLG